MSRYDDYCEDFTPEPEDELMSNREAQAKAIGETYW